MIHNDGLIHRFYFIIHFPLINFIIKVYFYIDCLIKISNYIIMYINLLQQDQLYEIHSIIHQVLITILLFLLLIKNLHDLLTYVLPIHVYFQMLSYYLNILYINILYGLIYNVLLKLYHHGNKHPLFHTFLCTIHIFYVKLNDF